MLNASYMKTLSASLLDEDAVEQRIHLAASAGCKSVLFRIDEIPAETYRTLRAEGYTLEDVVGQPLFTRISWG